MSSLPNEVLEDVLRPLDRWTLDVVQFTNHRFLQVIMKQLSDACLRDIDHASFYAPNDCTTCNYTICVNGQPDRKVSNADGAQLFSEFVQALRRSRVAHLTFVWLVFTPDLAALVRQALIVAGELELIDGSCVELTSTQFHEVALHFSPSFLRFYDCPLRACQISDELFRALSKNCGLRRWSLEAAPVDGGTFCVTDDAVVEFCMQQDSHTEQKGDDQWGELELHNGSFTKSLFKRLVEASAVSTRTQPLEINVSPVSFENEDLRDFTRYLSYRSRGTRDQLRIYNFPGEEHGALASMDLQIVLYPDNWLRMTRARRPHRRFCESDA